MAVLTSGGLDSAVLLGELAHAGHAVSPLYVRCGFRWEAFELASTREYLSALGYSNVNGLVVLDVPTTDLLRGHWSTAGDVPDERSPDEAVYLPGRNVLLLGKAMLWCSLNGIGAVALAVLRGNPFPDASESFFDAFEAAVNGGLRGPVRILRPYAELSKVEVLRRGAGFPIEKSASCLAPVEGRACGRCNKCAERHKVFREAGIPDPTVYRDPPV